MKIVNLLGLGICLLVSHLIGMERYPAQRSMPLSFEAELYNNGKELKFEYQRNVKKLDSEYRCNVKLLELEAQLRLKLLKSENK